ncbi:unnamed protein product [Rotaria sp. Silwood2]|nr:unnamed protein product [Rotaria sp. Silwood2]
MTIAQNIAYGKENTSIEDIIEAATKANIHHFIQQLPQIVQEALEKAQTDDTTRTSLIIAHRLSTIRSCDMICVLEKGYLVESGTHADLMKRRGAYYHMIIRSSTSVPNVTLYCNENDHPILSQLISFNLIIFTLCDIYSIAYILRCMPNLSRFYFTLASRMTAFSYYRELFNGFVWQQLLKRYVPCLSKFEFHISILKTFSSLNLHYYQVI